MKHNYRNSSSSLNSKVVKTSHSTDLALVWNITHTVHDYVSFCPCRQDAFDLVDVDFVLPGGTLLARVHLSGELHAQLRTAALARWVGVAGVSIQVLRDVAALY